MSDGQLAMNTNLVSPGLFLKDSNGDLVKAGPVHVGTTAPNATPGAGGQAGNSKGELWLDTSGSDYSLKTWDGTAFRAIVVTSTMIKDGTIVDADINASAAIIDTKLATIATAGKVSNSATTATNANTASAIVARDASGNFAAGTITAALTGNASTVTTNANLTGDVTSVGNATSIASGVIVNADVNASAAIAGTKISPDFGSQTIATTGVFSHALGAVATPSITFTGDPNTGIYSPGADQVAISTNGQQSLLLASNGDVSVNRGTLNLGTTGAEGGQLNLSNPTNTGTVYSLDAETATNARLFTIAINTDLSIGQLASTGGTVKFFTAANERARIDSSGRLLVGTTSDSGGALLQVNGDRIRIATAKTPASAGATGTTGEIAWDANYIYVCTATNTWKRTAIATW